MKIPSFRKLQVFFGLLWFFGCAGLLSASLLTEAYQPGLWAELYFLSVVVLSPATLATFGWDKWKAERDGRRIPEKKLHFLSILGGWPGAMLGQQWFRHKTLKPVFRTILLVIAGLHVALTAIIVFRQIQGP